MILYLSFPFTLIVLFGWSEFKRHYSSTVLVGQLAGLFNTLYLSFYSYMVLNTDTIKTDYVPALTFAVALLWGFAIPMRKIRQNHPTVSYSGLHAYFHSGCSALFEHLCNGNVLQIRGSEVV